MKTLLVTLGLVVASLFAQEVEKMVATFDGFDDGSFFFVDSDGNSLEFEQIDETVLEKFDLTSEEFQGKDFEVSYMTEVMVDEDDEETYISRIVDLKPLD